MAQAYASKAYILSGRMAVCSKKGETVVGENKDLSRSQLEQLRQLKNGVAYCGVTSHWAIHLEVTGNLIHDSELLDISRIVSLKYIHPDQRDDIIMISYVLTDSSGGIRRETWPNRKRGPLGEIQSEPAGGGGPPEAVLKRMQDYEPVSITITWKTRWKGTTHETVTLLRQ